MDMDDVYEWIVWGVLGVAFVMMALVVVMLLLGVINEVAYQIRRRRQQRLATTTPETPQSSSLVEKLLESIPDVEYLPAGAGAGSDNHSHSDSDRESCVICVTAYEAGEACSVLPACKHLFHKACVA